MPRREKTVFFFFCGDTCTSTHINHNEGRLIKYRLDIFQIFSVHKTTIYKYCGLTVFYKFMPRKETVNELN